MYKYQNIHRHSHRTNIRIADSVVTNEAYARRAAELGHGIISSCEHGWQGRYIECYELAKQYGLKFVQAAEAYWVKDRFEKDRTNSHIVLAAKNENGRRALNRALSEANKTGFYGQARLDLPLLLELPPQDIIVQTACVAYWRYDDIDDITLRLRDHFQNNFFLEVQSHNDSEETQRRLNDHILELSRAHKIPIIYGADSHYIYPEDAGERTDYITSKGMKYDDETGFLLDYPDGDEVYRRFAEQGVLGHREIEEALGNTAIYLDVQDYDCPCFNKEIKMPSLYLDKTQEERDALYESMIWQAWQKEKESIPSEKWPLYEKEIQKEIDIVHTTRHADYFMIDKEVVAEGIRRGGVITSTGRGSGPSFYTNKLFGLTEIDRISAQVKMYPERFMSPTRILESKSLADIDLNVADRAPFLEAQKAILGEDHSWPMIAYGTLKAKAAWKMYAKSQNVDFDIANMISNQIDKYENACKHAGDDADNIDPLDYIDEEYHNTYEQCGAYRGLTSHVTPHPCATLVYQGNISEEIGLINVKGEICCIMDGKWAEDYKFLKNDWLKASVVDMISRIYERIGCPRHTVSELIDLCPPEASAWDIYKKSCTLGINQVEQEGTARRVAIYGPRTISELCAFVAAIRPGFKSMYKTFESREHFEYGIPALDALLQTPEMPNSFVLYQELAMAVINYAGIPMSEAYDIIKNIAKKRVEKVLHYKEQFLDGFTRVLIDQDKQDPEFAAETAKKVWQILEDSSAYSFNACVNGQTRIPVATGFDSSTATVEEIHQAMHGDTPCRPVSFSMDDEGNIVLNEIVEIRQSGAQPVFRITTQGGSSIVCTANHKFPTPNGYKYCREMVVGDEVYVTGSSRAVIDLISAIEPAGEEMTYDVEMADPHHNFVTSTGFVTANSHSYSVAIDSLYGAYLKANHPCEFYETFLRILETNGDKDRLNAVRSEAEDYFNIKFPPYRFGQDNRAITADPKTNTIANSIAAIKGYSADAGRILYECSLEPHKNFMSVLKWLDTYSFKSAKVKPLIQIGYFARYGNTVELLRIMETFDYFKQGFAKSIRADAIEGKPMFEVFRWHATNLNTKGEQLKTYKITDMEGLLDECEAYIKAQDIPDLEYRVQAQNHMDILGYVDMTTGREEDRRKLFVTDVRPLEDKTTGKPWAYRIGTKSIGSGKNSRISVRTKLYESDPIRKGDIVYADKISKNRAGYWYLDRYTHIY